ncbi:MAG: hypothetical protein U0521_19715 [Anaerolineae bacterium]
MTFLTATPSPASLTPPPIPFDLGSEIFSFDHFGTLSEAGITWVKVQLRWRLGGLIRQRSACHQSGAQQRAAHPAANCGRPAGDGQQSVTYLNRFGTYLGEVAALAPDAIEVWGDMNAETGWVRADRPGGLHEMSRPLSRRSSAPTRQCWS